MTKIISLFGGPSSGKSCSAAFLYYQLKSQGHSVELVTEYVKEWAWTSRIPSVYDQMYIFGKQSRKESLLYNKVDWIVTDSPVMQNIYYANLFCPKEFADGVKAATLAFYEQAAKDKHKHLHVMLKRNRPYKSEGRYQNEEQAKEVDVGLLKLFNDLKIDYLESFPDEKDLLVLLNEIVK